MTTYAIAQNLDRCIGCLSCEVYCKENKGLPDGPRLCQIVMLGPRLVSGLPREAYVYMGCFHCEHPACVAACPTGAMRKRESDGIVYVEKDLCVGCKACMVACPWGAVQWNHEEEKVVKCDLCKDRLDQGLQPVCVTVCTTQCLSLSVLEDAAAAA
ncbi:4Fe-4S dicluster domain-containing protein [Desulfatirhabdium butyrativorans]|uniref:4Fe-4S dicluster domain-containing protein n=1 Tax=Desulfatirhabdium butyrativorans TaxID=340467 RepID=UPI00040ED6E9|nr:4Fe-4S dicluster domain-containing protein [Desulfatirhabdium butyrativorans]